MKPKDRIRARTLCSEHALRGDHLGWFDALYRQAEHDESTIPWADMVPNPHLVEWHRLSGFDFRARRCLKVGCGLGDDAEYLAAHAESVTAFDVAPTAIAWCRRRFQSSRVDYLTADVLSPPSEWQNQFDFILESYTLQVLPPELRAQAMRSIALLLAPSGTLLVICRSRHNHEPVGSMPWPLAREELNTFVSAGLQQVSFDDYIDAETPPVPRYRIQYARNA